MAYVLMSLALAPVSQRYCQLSAIGTQQVTADTKEMLRQSVQREESLRLSRGWEPSLQTA